MHALDLDKLPHFAQNELLDFYQFLIQKYANENAIAKIGQQPLAPVLVKPFEPLSREAVYER